MKDDGFIVRHVTAHDGLSLYVRDYPGPESGGKTPILCLHGLTRNSKDFANFAWHVGKSRRVIVPDIRGRGFSDYDPDPGNYDPARYVEDVRHILIALGLHQVVVVGTSMGGIVGMAMAAAMPTALKALVINDVGPVIRVKSLAGVIKYMQSPPLLDSWEEAGQHLKARFDGVFPITDDAMWTFAATTGYKQRPDGKITFDWDPKIVEPILQDKADVHDIWRLFLATAQIPTLIVRGAVSEVLEQGVYDEMLARHPNGSGVIVPDVGHAPSLGEPQSVEALNDFFQRV